jgi:hypothetical protein
MLELIIESSNFTLKTRTRLLLSALVQLGSSRQNMPYLSMISYCLCHGQVFVLLLTKSFVRSGTKQEK